MFVRQSQVISADKSCLVVLFLLWKKGTALSTEGKLMPAFRQTGEGRELLLCLALPSCLQIDQLLSLLLCWPAGEMTINRAGCPTPCTMAWRPTLSACASTIQSWRADSCSGGEQGAGELSRFPEMTTTCHRYGLASPPPSAPFSFQQMLSTSVSPTPISTKTCAHTYTHQWAHPFKVVISPSSTL